MTGELLLSKALRALESARLLLDAGDVDGACNRAYYAMFDAARAALSVYGEDPARTHKGVLVAFSERFVKSKILDTAMGRYLKQAEARRYIADYGGAATIREDGDLAVEQATTFIEAIENLLAGDNGAGQP